MSWDKEVSFKAREEKEVFNQETPHSPLSSFTALHPVALPGRGVQVVKSIIRHIGANLPHPIKNRWNANRIKMILQGKSTSNRIIFDVMKESGFSMSKIRRTLFNLHDINIKDLADERVGYVTLYNVLRDKSDNHEARERLAFAVGLKVAEFFPEN